ncbi:AMP-binding protein [Rhodococcus koreensis]|uniref:AMP-binding protein n=1 Tax=Rhodococcus koreensis TaxID=99653 RepID=UPI0036DA5443
MYGLTFGDLVGEHRRTHGSRTAAVCGPIRYTYADLDERTDRLANALAGEGVMAGERVLWLGQNCHRVLELILAAAKLGAMVCPVNWRQSAAELAFVIDDLRPAVVVWQREDLGDAVTAARAEAQHDSARWLVHDVDGPDSYEEFLAEGATGTPTVTVDEGDPLVVLYTAAFGGRPNGAQLTHRGILTQNANLMRLADMWRDYTYLDVGPLFHIGTLSFMMATFHIGGTNVLTRRADPTEVMNLIARERCRSGMVLPPTIARIVELNGDGHADLSSFESNLAIPGWSEMVSPDKTPLGITRFGGYGQTEVSGLDAYSAYGGDVSVSTAGLPTPWTRVRIVDDSGTEVPDGDTGEIVFLGPMVHAGYWNRPELNAQRTRSGGWHTNDIGRREADGSVAFIGPKVQMIKSGVENIYPAEVEACLREAPGVREAAIIGIPDDQFVQSVKAVIVLEEGAVLVEDEIIEHCRTRIASYKKPKSVAFLDSLPRTTTGAVDYAALDMKFGGGGYPGGVTRSQ